MENGLTHFDKEGNAVMVDVSGKNVTYRTALATGYIAVGPEIMACVTKGNVKKGDVLGVARVAGIMGVKKTSELIPMCHPLPIQKCAIDYELDQEKNRIHVFCTVKTEGKTGVEMEALTGVQVTLLTIYDMCKAIDKHMVMSEIHLIEKTGGKSGDFRFEEKMIDRCGRKIDYLRISVTDRCNLRCIYCMPEDGIRLTEREKILQEPEILRICRVMSELGITKIKITGGEPLVRPRIPGLIRQIKEIPGIQKVTLTTNGILLKDQMQELAESGLDSLNISLILWTENVSAKLPEGSFGWNTRWNQRGNEISGSTVKDQLCSTGIGRTGSLWDSRVCT